MRHASTDPFIPFLVHPYSPVLLNIVRLPTIYTRL